MHGEDTTEEEAAEELEWFVNALLVPHLLILSVWCPALRFDNRVVDKSGDLARALAEQVHAGDPDGEGVIWPHLAEISLLGGLGCGSWLLRLAIEQLEVRVRVGKDGS